MGCSNSTHSLPVRYYAKSTINLAATPNTPRVAPGPTGSQLLDKWLSQMNAEDAHQVVTLCRCYEIIDDDVLGEMNCTDFKDLGVPKHIALLVPWTERGQYNLDGVA